ncbi:cation transporter [Paraburkholderia sediminicola]|uniref:cation transporter n=1 Tax=Paraburkholderia sediminicola TaxID=458836 RepID=UPI0038BAABA8
MSCDCGHSSANTENERKTLRVALMLNATKFVVGMAAGLWAQSSGLMADALDMLTDATAYGLGLMAVTRGMRAVLGSLDRGDADAAKRRHRL